MVLLLDNDDDFRAALAAHLTDDGHRVAEYRRSAEVPALASLGASALIIDGQLDLASGLAFADRFHAAYPAAPIVMLTAYDGLYLRAEVAQRPYITLHRKPLDYEAVAQLLPTQR